jgi:two-component system, OmpR family, response regulator CiaR
VKILVADSDQHFLQRITSFLNKEGYTYDTVGTFCAASEKVNLYEYDCILMELKLPDQSGLNLLELLKHDERSDGVIVISNPTTLEQKLKTFELGADDFLTKPIEFSELIARIKAVVRRKKFNVKSKLYFANLVIDLSLKKVFIWDNALSLTKKEYEILLHLIANKNRVVSKGSLAEYLWGEHADSVDSYDFLFAHIKNLRKKLKGVKAEVEIKNSYKMGYQIIEI